MEQDFVYPQIASNSWSRVNFQLVSPSSCVFWAPFSTDFQSRGKKSVYWRSATSGFMWPQRLHTMHPRIVKIVKICGRNPRQNDEDFFPVPLTLELANYCCFATDLAVATDTLGRKVLTHQPGKLVCIAGYCWISNTASAWPKRVSFQQPLLDKKEHASKLNFSFCFSPLKNNSVGFHPAHLKFVLLWLSWLFVIFRIVCSQWSLPWLTCRSLVRPPTASAAQTLWSGTGKPVPMRKNPRVWLSMTVTPQKSNWDTKNGHF